MDEPAPYAAMLRAHLPWWFYASGLAVFITLVCLVSAYQQDSEVDPCKICEVNLSKSFSGRIVKSYHGHGNLTGLQIRYRGRMHKISDVNPRLKFTFTKGDSIRKVSGTTEALVSDAFQNWRAIRLFECADTTGCR